MAQTGVHGRTALITGGAGGVGMASARLLGRSHDLILADANGDALVRAGQQLELEGFAATCIAGDLAEPETLARIVEACVAGGTLRTLVNAAGMSPSMGDWRTIVRVNAVVPARLLDALFPLIGRDTVAVLLASVAGHLGPPDAACDALLADPACADLIDRIEAPLEALLGRVGGTIEGHAYSLAKRAVLTLCERRAKAFGEKGARIVSVSPGGVWTAMGRREAEVGRRITGLIEASPIGRWATAMDIATAIDFLASDQARYITGCDLRVDGGAVAGLRGSDF